MPDGRWPANVIMDLGAAALLDDQSGEMRDGVAVQRNGGGQAIFGGIGDGENTVGARSDAGYGGSGGASRFVHVIGRSEMQARPGTAPDWKVLQGDCVEVMRTLPEASVDAVVCDPPYGLGFMGKEWDSAAALASRPPSADEIDARFNNAFPRTGKGSAAVAFDGLAFQAWCTEWAREALRVLRPGGHLLAFGGTRTYHRLACAVEDAGFEIRDCLAWLYGSGFPKSLDVSKQIDKQRHDVDDVDRVRAWLNERRVGAGITLGAINEAFGHASNGGGSASAWMTNPTSRNLPTMEQWERLRGLIGFGNDMDAEVERLNARKGTLGDDWLSRDITGQHAQSDPRLQTWAELQDKERGTAKERRDVPATPDAERWQGWGTALKPAHEPIVLARKPLTGTVAATVLEFGTGALNIDATRIGTDERWEASGHRSAPSTALEGGVDGSLNVSVSSTHEAGRWPANVCLDLEAARLLDEQTAHLQQGVTVNRNRDPEAIKPASVYGTYRNGTRDDVTYGDSGGASRFLYVAKASSAERNAGLDGFEAEITDDGRQVPIDNPYLRGETTRRNVHPTVKPIELMRWLCRLVTPPGGLVLDPFTGSGTTGAAAVLEGFRFVGVEREAEYLAIAEARIRWWAEHPEGMRLVERLEAEAEHKGRRDAGQIGLFDMPAESVDVPGNGRAGEASAEERYTDRGSSNFAMKPGKRRD